MSKKLAITYRREMVEELGARFALRAHNIDALDTLVKTLAGGDYDPVVQQVLHMATGAGKTYLMAALIEYLRGEGVYNVLVVTPGLVVQEKTVANFVPGNRKYIPGALVPPLVAKPSDLTVTTMSQEVMGQRPIRLFVFNVQQLIAPVSLDGATKGTSSGAARRGMRKDNEVYGNIFAQLKGMDDLVLIADESHLYGTSAKAFSAALRELDPAAAIGLTASASLDDHVIYTYPLYQAIADCNVKTPVLAFRTNGYGEGSNDSERRTAEERQLRDAMNLLAVKEQFYDQWAHQEQVQKVNPVLFVVCSDTEHAAEVERLLVSPAFFGNSDKVLRIDSTTVNDTVRRKLDDLDQSTSPVRAVVSVDMLKEGWDVKNIAVMCTLRAMASDVLTAQTMGRGLRLPYGFYTDIPAVNQLDIISHQSFRTMLNDEKILRTFGLEDAVRDGGPPRVGTFDVSTGVSSTPTSDGLGNSATAVDGDQSEIDPASVDTDAADTTQTTTPASETPTHTGPFLVDLGDGVDEQPALTALEVVVNQQFANLTFLFPSTRMERVSADFALSKVDDSSMRSAAHRVTGAGVVIHREEIHPRVAQRVISTKKVTQAEGEALQIEPADAEATLLDLIATHQSVPRTKGNLAIARAETVPRFMSHVKVSWTEKSLLSAIKELADLLTAEAKRIDRERPTETIVEPRRLPIASVQTYGLGARTYELVDDRTRYVNGRLYAPFDLALFPAVKFDSYSGEYALARLLETSSHVGWWKKLYPEDQARIAYTVRDNYYPDFVVFDHTDDMHWIVEGKSETGRNDAAVQAKRLATEELVRELLGHDVFVGQRWGYFIAYENDISASESWTDLKNRADTVGGRIYE